MDDIDWNDLEQLLFKGTITRIIQLEKMPLLPQNTSPHSGQDTRQNNFEGQQDAGTNHKLVVIHNPTEVTHNVATKTTERPMQASGKIAWINKDPHTTTTPHHSRKEERRNTEDEHSDWEVDNLD